MGELSREDENESLVGFFPPLEMNAHCPWVFGHLLPKQLMGLGTLPFRRAQGRGSMHFVCGFLSPESSGLAFPA